MLSASPIALVDCNNFFVSCERLFRPDLKDTPVIVLSSNDGCVISRSNEAKVLGFKMGEPYFQIKDRCRKYAVAVFSSNFALYRDLSRRVMHTLRRFSDTVEVYSIDEAFLSPVFGGDIQTTKWGREVRETVLREVGIPVSVGVAPTKTLAKVAVHRVKKEQTVQGVSVLLDHAAQQQALACTPVEEVWGIGFRLAPRLRALGIETAADLTARSDVWVRSNMGVCGLRTLYELRGQSCFLAGEDTGIRKSLLHSQSFGTPTRTYRDIVAAVTYHARKVAEILRAEQVVTSEIVVILRTARRAAVPYAASAYEVLPFPTNDTLVLVHTAVRILERIFRPEYRYAKAGVLVRDIVPGGAVSVCTLFGEQTNERAPLMHTLDDLRHQFGDVLRVGSEYAGSHWYARSAHGSPRYTTTWAEVARAPSISPSLLRTSAVDIDGAQVSTDGGARTYGRA